MIKPAKEIKVRLTTFEDILGSAPGDTKVFETFMAKNAPDAPTREEEIMALGLDTVSEKAKTVFFKLEDGTPYYWDYNIRGGFKDSCGLLARMPGSESSKLKAYKKVIDGLIFIKERAIKIQYNGFMEDCQRPLRGETAQGPRVALANSESIPAPAVIEFTIQLFDPKLEKVVLEWLDYGVYRGLGQWRNSGKGRFTYEVLPDDYEIEDITPKVKELVKKNRKKYVLKKLTEVGLDVSNVEITDAELNLSTMGMMISVLNKMGEDPIAVINEIRHSGDYLGCSILGGIPNTDDTEDANENEETSTTTAKDIIEDTPKKKRPYVRKKIVHLELPEEDVENPAPKKRGRKKR